VNQFDKKSDTMVFTEWNMKLFKRLYVNLTIAKPLRKVTLMLFKVIGRMGLHLFEASELDGRKRTPSNPRHVIYGQRAPHHGTHYVDCRAEWDSDWSRCMENENIACFDQVSSLVTVLTTLSWLSSQHDGKRFTLFHSYYFHKYEILSQGLRQRSFDHVKTRLWECQNSSLSF
jgi:hypothetical protein